MKLKQLQSILEDVEKFTHPKIHLEQYATPSNIASTMLFIANSYNDIENKRICDLGCGCAILSIGSALLGGGHVIGVEIDDDALSIARHNIDEFGREFHVDLIKSRVEEFPYLIKRNSFSFDTVIMNPPFGTRLKGADIQFLQSAFQVSNIVYSLHKSSTRKFVQQKALQLGFESDILSQIRYNIDSSYKHHKKKSLDIEVDFIRFRRIHVKQSDEQIESKS